MNNSRRRVEGASKESGMKVVSIHLHSTDAKPPFISHKQDFQKGGWIATMISWLNKSKNRKVTFSL
ncbi:hypothetical protein K5X82_01635 [Halosquirtibacter xylanolyticus]|uniref:hypothetical protein n=1 Tax=Halosquirtibacter xylanolyticus TaxID=3374599 RepID=UPI00374A399A|nr:hypothetical protein K5X82_01635 [Prolixibacteraceae bacterium]